MNTQTPLTWNLLPNSPVASSRTDDIWFFNEQVGWLVNSSGYVCKTTDGGDCWAPKFYLCPSSQGKPYLRCMGWGSEQVGWFGSVTGISDAVAHGDPNRYLNTLLHHTTDGGENWAAVTNLPQGTSAGICGFYAVNEQVAYGSGTNDPGLPGPTVIKTTDGGANWTLIDMKEHADNLIDIYFFDEDNGIVVGGKNADHCPTCVPGYPRPRLSKYEQLRPVVLRTSDGGASWTNVAAETQGLKCGEWGWKINFINEQFGFISLENFVSAAILKTTDGGDTWTRHDVKDQCGNIINEDLEGIGFINENQGWVGGWGKDFNGLMNCYSEDGGITWISEDHNNDVAHSDPRIAINRYRFIGNPVTAGYCSGKQVYKLQIGCASGKKQAFAGQQSDARLEPCNAGNNTSNNSPVDNASKRAFAEPAALVLPEHDFDLSYQKRDDGSLEISYTLPEESDNVFLGLWNQFAFYVKTLVSGAQNKGRQTIVWDGKDEQGNPVGEGVYICRMSTNGEQGASGMVQLEG